MVELLSRRARQHPERRAYTFLSDGELEEDHLTYRDLDLRARTIAALLQRSASPGERALLVYPSGLDFITAFFGCLYSGIIAVPIYPPQTRAKRGLTNVRAIAADVQPAIVLIPSSISSSFENIFAQVPELQTTRLITTDDIVDNLADTWQDPAVTDNTLAFLQYTSGTSGTPKGVMLTHRNLMYNLSVIYQRFDASNSHGLIWLPLYHDMGLIGGILRALYCGGQTTIMSPVAFLQHPLRWLQTLSRSRATISGGPNFAYDLCVRKITSEQKATLDLHHWEIAFNGAETIRHETLERFIEAFGPRGFRKESFCPCYGLAEATLMVSGEQKAAPPIVRTVQAAPLEQNRVVEAASENASTRTLIGCGQTMPGQKIVIVNPESLTQSLPHHVGEVWVSGPSIAQGYWQRPEETQRTFHAYLLDTQEGPFLRTGDLGFLQDGELFITGRLKELIIIRGRNHYPRDIETTVEDSHPALRPNCGAAFSVDIHSEERLVIVQEVERQYRSLDVDEVVEAIRQAVAEERLLQVYAVVLVKMGSVPKTSSGKIQRYACREGFLAHKLDVLGEWTQQLEEEDHLDEPAALPKKSLSTEVQTAQVIQTWLISQISQCLNVPHHSIDIREPLVHYGMDSVQAVTLVGDLENWLGRRLPSTLAYDYPTIQALTRYLVGESDMREPGVSPHLHSAVEGSTRENRPEELQNPELLLANLDQLSDDEVDALLHDMLQEGIEE